jgi:predicted dehydrogenase
VGTGYWARVTHGAVLAAHPDVELVGVWGRDPAKTAEMAAELGTKPFGDYHGLLAEVDAVSFAIAPDVQGRLAIEAAQAGKHLLLDKPLCTTAEVADRLVEAADAAGVSSVVFFTLRFAESSRQWLADAEGGGWKGGWARFIVSAFADESPYSSSPWRRTKGAMWDVGPHALSILMGGLGPVSAVTGVGGDGDLVHLVLEHHSGATSTASLTLGAPKPAITVEMALWGERGLTTLPRQDSDPKVAFGRALDELLEDIGSGRRSHPCDVHFGAAVVRVLADAEAQVQRR